LLWDNSSKINYSPRTLDKAVPKNAVANFFCGQNVHTRIRCRSKMHVKMRVYKAKENRRLRSLVHLLPGRSTVAVQFTDKMHWFIVVQSNDASSCYQGARHGAAECSSVKWRRRIWSFVVAGHTGATRVIVAMHGAAWQQTGARSRDLTHRASHTSCDAQHNVFVRTVMLPLTIRRGGILLSGSCPSVR